MKKMRTNDITGGAILMLVVLLLLVLFIAGCMSIDNSTTYRLDHAVVSGNVELVTNNDIDTAKDAAVTDPDGGTVMTGEGSDAITPDFSGLVGAATGAAGSAIGGLGDVLRRDDKDDETLPEIVDDLYTGEGDTPEGSFNE